MPQYSYTARDRAGQIIRGSFTGESRAEVAAYIRGRGLYVTQIREAAPSISFNLDLSVGGGVGTKDLALFCRLFATMLEAGLSMNNILLVLIEQTTNKKLRETLKTIYRKVQEGEALYRSLSEHPRVFPPVMISMVEAGELGGVLDNVLERLAVQFEKEHKLNEKIKSAMAYPAVVVGMALVSLTFILTFVLPTFVKMFTDMKIELPLLTRILVAASVFVQTYWPLLLLLVAGAVIGFAYLAEKPGFRQKVDPLLLQIPVFGLLMRKIAIARFTRTLGSLLRGGVPILQAIEVVKKTTANYAMISALTNAQNSIRQGSGIAGPLKESGVFPPMVIHMTAIGEESGELDRMLDKIADFYESDVDDMAGRLSSMLEPMLIGFLGILIGLIVVAVLLPIFDIVSGAGH
ncbi:secretion system protein [Anaerosporomusa subterranea]|uniref:Secretion system protein n=1 Tax=Anaerosporomusa subterranea TaxID=1794912 RepID=A0A154BTB5_ANASB|nr:type II secretion system F family protein [Anaerosporomusa subterranea]KYZ77070.1 secretion system protein [Anaerosporomusa subterranea]